MEEKKFVCKYCNKKYPCGKSLGGHIKTHMTAKHYSSLQSKEGRTNNADDSVVKFDGGRRKRKRDFGSEEEEEEEAASGNPIYGLRENPKKTTRFVHSKVVNVVAGTQQQQERFCKECGKGFLSLKALCGHMACHSEKDKGMMNSSGFSMKQKLVVGSQSDTETSSSPNHPRRCRRTRFKTVKTDKNDHHPSFVSLANGSSSVSEVEQEQEEVARCLMLLSKDTSHKGRFVLPTESSDNNSVVVEAKSPPMNTIITLKNGKKSSVSNGFEMVKDKKKKKVVQYNNGIKLKKSAEIVDSDDSDSGYFRNGPKKLEFSIDGYPRKREFKTPKVELRSGCEFDQSYDAESRKKMLIKNRGRTRSTEPRKLILEDLDYNTITDGSTREELINWRKRPRYDDSLCQNNSVGVSCKRTPNGFHRELPLKPPESLKSEQVIIDGSQDLADESDESSTDTDAYTAPRTHSSCKVINGKKESKFKKKLKSKKSRDHECPICYKNFKSGQALGGHKRSHFIGGSEEDNTVVVIKQDNPPIVPCLIDLNLPAPSDD